MPPGDPYSELASLRIERKQPKTTSGGRRLPWGWIVVLAVLGGGGYLAYPRARQLIEERTLPEVPTAMVVKSGGPTTVLVGSGYVNAETDVVIGVTTGGRLMRRPIRKGDRVRRGQLIAQLDDSELRAQLDLAKAQLADSERTLKRAEMLREMKAGTEADFEKALSARDIARANIAVLDARIKQMRVVAPMDATVIETLAEPGEILMPAAAGQTVGKGSGIAKIADLRRTVVEVDVNESDVSRIAIGQRADITLDSHAGRQFAGRVLELARQADKAKATVQAKVLFEAPEAGVLPGMSAKVQFRPKQAEKVEAPRVVMPKKALLPGGNAVFLVQSGKATRRVVETRDLPGAADLVEVVMGVGEGDVVVTGELDRLTDGMTLPKKK